MADQFRKIVLHCPHGYRPSLDARVAKWLEEGVSFIGVIGADCERIHDVIDDLIIDHEEKSGESQQQLQLTSWDSGETLAEAVAAARALTSEDEGDVEVIVLV